MWDTFRPLQLTEAWRELDNPAYAYSWNEDKSFVPSSDGHEGASIVTGPSA
jgi:hypothetical protein